MIKIKEILNPINALALGNSFKDEYCFYKYKQDDFTNIKTEKENLLILIMSYRFNLIDMSYLLDINPILNIEEVLYNIHVPFPCPSLQYKLPSNYDKT